MGIQDNWFTIGDEAVAWGTKAATLTRGIECKSDPSFEHDEVQRESIGMRPSILGIPDDRATVDLYGGKCELPFDILSKSHGLAFGAIATTVATTTPVGATDARLHTFTPGTAGVSRSLTVHAGAYDITGTVHHHDYLGCMAKELKISQGLRGPASAALSMIFKAVDLSAASVTPSYPTSPLGYTDRHCEVTLDGTTQCQRTFDLTIPTGLSDNRERICPGGLEKPLLENKLAGPTGTLSIDYPGDTFYAAYLAGTVMDNLVITWTGGEIETGFDYFLRLTFPKIQFTGSAPKVDMTQVPEQPLPWRALADSTGTEPLWKIEYQTDDTAP